jgi:branched-chain amino acid transport system permease protein
MHELATVGISGVSNGSVYAMMALGMALVYGVSKHFNFAYGSFYMMGGYLAWFLLSFGFSYPVVFAGAISLVFLIGLAVERYTLRPLRARKEWEMLVVMSTLGLALFLDNLYLAIFGPFVKALPPLFGGSINLGGFVISMQSIGIALIAMGVITGLLLFLHRTREGMAMRAVALDMVGAEIVGIPKDRVFCYAFGIATALAAIGGILLAPKYFVWHAGGWEIMVKAWVITVFGGMGSVVGAVYAAFILGMVEAVMMWQVGATWTIVAWFAVLIGIFIFRPRGLLGTWG